MSNKGLWAIETETEKPGWKSGQPCFEEKIIYDIYYNLPYLFIVLYINIFHLWHRTFAFYIYSSST